MAKLSAPIMIGQLSLAITPAQAENLIAQDCADMIGVGRAIFKDAHWADKIVE